MLTAAAQALRRRTLNLTGNNVLRAVAVPPTSASSAIARSAASSSVVSGPVSPTEESALVPPTSNISASHSTAASISSVSTSILSDNDPSAVPSATSVSDSGAVSSAAASESISATPSSPSSAGRASAAPPSTMSSAKATSTFAVSGTRIQAKSTTTETVVSSTSEPKNPSTSTDDPSSTTTLPSTSKTSMATTSSTSKTQIKVPTTTSSTSLAPVSEKPSTSSDPPQVPTTSVSTTRSTSSSNPPPITATGEHSSVSSPQGTTSLAKSPTLNPSGTIAVTSTRAGVVSVATSSMVNAESTFSQPVSVTLTTDGHTITTAPSLITSISTSTASNGSVATFSSVFANPSAPVVKSGLADNSSFFDDKAKVAGVFIAVAVIVVGLIGGLIFRCRRRRRANAIRGLVIPENRFRREMAEQRTTYQPGRLPGGFGSISDDPQRHLMAPSLGSAGSHHEHAVNARSNSLSSRSGRSYEAGHAGIGALGLTGVHNRTGSQVSPIDPTKYDGPFSDYLQFGETRLMAPTGTAIGIAISGDPVPEKSVHRQAEERPPSPAPSSPSIYPPSLPPVPEKDEKEDDLLFYQQETKRRPSQIFPQAPQKAYVHDTNVQNPFASPFDDMYNATRASVHRRPAPAVPPKISTGQAYQPLTPPHSSPGHSPVSGTMTDSPNEPAKHVSPYGNGILGRPVFGKIEPMRPRRNPLRAVNMGDRPSSMSSSSSGHA